MFLIVVKLFAENEDEDEAGTDTEEYDDIIEFMDEEDLSMI